jgi:hypothetical protein
MGVRFTKGYVDEVFAGRDYSRLYHLISLVDEEPDLPEELWLFNRMFEWSCSDWQFYEHISVEKFHRILADLEQVGLDAISQKFREGKLVWDDPELLPAFEGWLEAHAKQIAATIFVLAERRRGFLLQAVG